MQNSLAPWQKEVWKSYWVLCCFHKPQFTIHGFMPSVYFGQYLSFLAVNYFQLSLYENTIGIACLDAATLHKSWQADLGLLKMENSCNGIVFLSIMFEAPVVEK